MIVVSKTVILCFSKCLWQSFCILSLQIFDYFIIDLTGQLLWAYVQTKNERYNITID